MTRWFVLLVWGLACLSPLPLFAEPSSNEALTKELMKLSGLEFQLRQSSQQMLDGLNERRKELPTDQHNALRRALGEAFKAETLERLVSQHIQAHLPRDVAEKTLVWLRTDLGRTITKLEEAASTTQGTQKMQSYAQQLAATPPPPSRLQLARRLDRATRSSETLLTLMEAMELGIAQAADAAEPKERRLGIDRLRVQIERKRPLLREASEQSSIVAMLYAYQSLSDDQLERYRDFLTSEIGRRYITVTTTAVREAHLMAIDKMSRALDVKTSSDRQ